MSYKFLNVSKGQNRGYTIKKINQQKDLETGNSYAKYQSPNIKVEIIIISVLKRRPNVIIKGKIEDKTRWLSP